MSNNIVSKALDPPEITYEKVAKAAYEKKLERDLEKISDLDISNNTIKNKKKPEASESSLTKKNYSNLDILEKCVVAHTGENKCNITLNMGNDLQVNLPDIVGYAGSYLSKENSVPFPSLLETNLTVKVQGGIECQKLVQCIQNNMEM